MVHSEGHEDRRSAADRRITRRGGGRREADRLGRQLVLIVEDHIDSRELLAAAFHGADVAIAEAGDGREALQQIASAPPDLVLLDLSLPDCDGLEIVRKLKADPAMASVPVVALTASVRAADREDAERAGCVAFLAKPVLPDQVVALARRLLKPEPA